MRIWWMAALVLLLGGLGWTQEALQTGQKVPDFELINQDGKATRLSSFQGKVVMVTFLYTRCPYPDKCPMIADKLGKTRDLLDKLKAKDQFQVLSITIDPEHDTPERLKQYAQGNEHTASNWTFLTGKPADVAKVAGAFGVIYWEEKGIVEHNLRTALIDPQGRLARLFTGSDWKPGEVATAIKELLPAH